VTHQSPLLRRVEFAAVITTIATVLVLGGNWARIAKHFGLYHHAVGSPPVQLWVEYGDPTPLARSAGDAGPNRRVCKDKLRPSADGGSWTCDASVGVDAHSIGQPAIARPPGPCSHERVNQATHAWECWTTVDPPPSALNRQPGVELIFGDIRGAGFCLREARVHERWRCVEPGVRISGFKVVQVLAAGTRCTVARVADQVTGVWACRRNYR
jgi:hypothetical protein